MSRHYISCRGIFLICFYLLSIARGACSDTSQKVVLILTSGYSVNSLLKSDNPTIASVIQHGALALLNCNTPDVDPIPSVTLTLLSGTRQHASARDTQCCEPSDWIGEENAPCRVVYERRTGSVPDAVWTILAPAIEWLKRQTLSSSSLSTAMSYSRPPVSPTLVQSRALPLNDRVAASALVNQSGLGMGLLHASTAQILSSLSTFLHSKSGRMLVIVLSAPSSQNPQIHPSLRLVKVLQLIQQHMGHLDNTDLLLADMFSESIPGLPAHWKPLTMLVAEGSNFPVGLLTSATTRTEGVVSDTDVAPTVLYLLGYRTPLSMTGRRVISRTTANRIRYIMYLNHIYLLNTYVSIHTLPVPALLLGTCAMMAVWYWRKGASKVSRAFGLSILILLALPAGLLITPALDPKTPLSYLCLLVTIMLTTVLAGFIIAKLTKWDISLAIVGIDLLGISYDTLNGQYLQKISLPGNYAISGIRYYGVGNEILGIVLGFIIIGSFIILQDLKDNQKNQKIPRRMLYVSWLWFFLIMGWPTLGANSGSILICSVGFGLGWWVLQDKTVRAINVMLSLLTGIIISFLFAAIDRLLSGSNASQAGEALYASSHGRGVGYLLEIVDRKLKMNMHLLFSPYLLISAVSVGLLVVLIKYIGGRELMQVLKGKPLLMKGINIFGITLFIAIVFKDSGFVTVTYAVGSGSLLLVWFLLKSPFMHNTNNNLSIRKVRE